MPNRFANPEAEISQDFLKKHKENRLDKTPEGDAINQQIENKLLRFTRTYPTFGRVLYLRYVEDYGFEDIAIDVDRTHSWVYHIQTAALIAFAPYVTGR